MDRINQSDLDQLVVVARNQTRLPIVLNNSYGRVRLQLAVGSHGAVKDLSFLGTKREIYLWLSTFLSGYAYAYDIVSGEYTGELLCE
jgi:hypothetical protein